MSNKKLEVIQQDNLYKWAKNFKRLQDRFYNNQFKLRRLQQIEDFVKLNGYNKVFHIEEVILDLDIPTADTIDSCDLVLVTHPGYSRYPLAGIIEQVKTWLHTCNSVYLCLNRHYINIDNVKLDYAVPDNFLQAITYWLQKELDDCVVVDMSRDYMDLGRHFTWSCPDRHYYIRKYVA